MNESLEPDPTSAPDAERITVAEASALPAGSRIDEFEVLRVLGCGGFGIVYLALDRTLQREIALKEYFPATLAGRAETGGVTVRRLSMAETYETGLRSFVNEARLLARFDHPSLVKVHRFWEAHGTAYMVMPYYAGSTLLQLRKSMSLPPEEAWLRRVQDGLLGALEVLHEARVYHRDVSPDNIVMQPGGAPVLLDFGAARQVLADQTRLLTAVIKPRYAPIEQYADLTEGRQGPWTDIYATAATLFFCITGHAPPNAATRIVHDDYRPLRERPELLEPAVGRPFGRGWLAAIDWALEIRPQARPQSIAQWREALDGAGGASSPLPVMTAEGPSGWRDAAPAPILGPAADDDREPTLAPPISIVQGPGADDPLEPTLHPAPLPPEIAAAPEPSLSPAPPAPAAPPELTAEAEAYAATEYLGDKTRRLDAPELRRSLAPAADAARPAQAPAPAEPMTADQATRTPAPQPQPLGWHWLAAVLVLGAAVLGLAWLLQSGA